MTMAKAKWVLRWYDAEEHTQTYTSWDSLQHALKRLVGCGMKVEVTAA
jgi:hypothetical protein